MASVAIAPSSVTLATVGATADVTLTVSGVPAPIPGVSGGATFPVSIDGVVVNGTLSLAWPTVPSPVPAHSTPTLDAALTGRVTLVRQSLSADGISAVYRATRTS